MLDDALANILDKLHGVLPLAGLVGKGDVVDVRAFPARRSVMLVTFVNGDSLLLKWLDRAPERSTDNEVVILNLLDEIDLPKATRSAIPRLYWFDTEEQVLILEGLHPYTTLRDRASATEAFPLEWLIAMAAALAGLHRYPTTELVPRYPDRRLFLPIRSMMDLTPSEFASGCGLDYRFYVNAVQNLDRQIEELLDNWTQNHLIHFDFRDDNILLKDPEADHQKPLLKIVDWELAGFGDPLYDVGALVGQFLYYWLGKVHTPGCANPKSALSLSTELNLGASHNIIRFVTAYLHFAKDAAFVVQDTPLRIIRYAGLFLLLRALGRLEMSGSLGRSGHLCILYGQHLLAQPGKVANILLPPWGV